MRQCRRLEKNITNSILPEKSQKVTGNKTMGKFYPIKFNYHLVEDNETVLHYQKNIEVLNPEFKDIIELVYHKEADYWTMIVRPHNLKHFLPDITFDDIFFILFAGRITSDFDFEFIFSRIIKKPEHLILIG